MGQASLVVITLLSAIMAEGQKENTKPTVFVRAVGNIELTSNFATLSTPLVIGTSHSQIGHHDETMEVARDLLKSCPDVKVTMEASNPEPDYFLILNRQEEHGFVFKAAISQVMVLKKDKSVFFSDKAGTVAKAVRAACKALASDWGTRTKGSGKADSSSSLRSSSE